ncbi:MAG: hypothetical protein MJY94_00195 [Bacteroidales bacterium]|nr:hypothetical protein [Bacteroidales bacterium]
MRKLVLIAFAALSILTGCSKLEVNDENLLGEWLETYEDYPYFMQDGFVEWTFRPDSKVDIHIYDVFAGDSNVSMSFELKEVDGRTVISVNTEMDESRMYPDYVVTKLTRNEMEWQMVGTEFTPGTVGSDFRHFTRK